MNLREGQGGRDDNAFFPDVEEAIRAVLLVWIHINGLNGHDPLLVRPAMGSVLLQNMLGISTYWLRM